MDSVKVNDWVSGEILNFPHPHHIKYEMFLDKGGKENFKITRKCRDITKMASIWNTSINTTSVVQKNHRARELGFEDIPSLMDEYAELEKIYFGKIKKFKMKQN
ncbi:MAG: hypothetical protein CM1200mP23_0580 [Nitrososphaerota archaeon]|nr:MAG: hypothetical protein CM1200mP23_0580 [Nitrososphaerota archaeon]